MGSIRRGSIRRRSIRFTVLGKAALVPFSTARAVASGPLVNSLAATIGLAPWKGIAASGGFEIAIRVHSRRHFIGRLRFRPQIDA
jgi:hypothetical protein